MLYWLCININRKVANHILSNHFLADLLAAAGGRGPVGMGGSPVVLVSNLNEEVRVM